MLITEIVGHHRDGGSVHQIGRDLLEPRDDDFAMHPTDPAPGDLLLVWAPDHRNLRVLLEPKLPDGVAVVLILPTEPAHVPVDEVVTALLTAGLQLIEAAVVSGLSEPAVAVVARRTDALLLPAPGLAKELEPPSDQTEGTYDPRLARLLAESTLERLTLPAREREVLAELSRTQLALRSLEDRFEKEGSRFRTERKALRNKLKRIESSKSYRLATSLAKASGRLRRLTSRQR